LVYDQQCEAYVKGLLATMSELEQELRQANQSLPHRHKEGNSEENNPDKKQEYRDKVLLTAKHDLKAPKITVSQLQQEQSELRKKYDQQSRAVKDLHSELIHMSTEDFESETLDRQSLQLQLHKGLKELCEAREQITRLKTTNGCKSYLSEPSCSNTHEFHEQPPMQDPALYHTSSPKISNLLDRSFLECPRCRAKYPTSRHRELLTHIDYCLE
ncbi:CEP55 protein, partial [Polyodon spathula]|nr:CEP55 protein [Polyodon spathula]